MSMFTKLLGTIALFLFIGAQFFVFLGADSVETPATHSHLATAMGLLAASLSLVFVRWICVRQIGRDAR